MGCDVGVTETWDYDCKMYTEETIGRTTEGFLYVIPATFNKYSQRLENVKSPPWGNIWLEAITSNWKDVGSHYKIERSCNHNFMTPLLWKPS